MKGCLRVGKRKRRTETGNRGYDRRTVSMVHSSSAAFAIFNSLATCSSDSRSTNSIISRLVSLVVPARLFFVSTSNSASAVVPKSIAICAIASGLGVDSPLSHFPTACAETNSFSATSRWLKPLFSRAARRFDENIDIT